MYCKQGNGELSRVENLINTICYHSLKLQFYLDVAWVKHNSNPSTDALRGKISRELALYYSVASMAPAHLTPVHSEFASVLATSRRSFSDVSNALSKVKLGIFLGVTAFDFDKGGVVVLVAEATLVSKNGSREIKTNWLGVLLSHFNLIGFVDAVHQDEGGEAVSKLIKQQRSTKTTSHANCTNRIV